jgi:UDP-N-acetylglucosamine 2-epimerase (non-hydrolysing)
MKILSVVGARPNFMKAAPVVRALRQHPARFTSVLVHTGQHYDANMSDVFFTQLDIPAPDVNLAVASGSHAVQTAEVMTRFEPVVLAERPDWVVVYGDVNSTVACALVCAKLGIRVAHVEAGLRSFDRTMPEEINRLVTDQLADRLYTPSPEARDNLLREGIADEKIRFVGNVMIDSLIRMLDRADPAPVLNALPPHVARAGYVLVTLHRPGNVDDPATLAPILDQLQALSADRPVLFPVHPRTRARLRELPRSYPGLTLLDPVGYLEFLGLTRAAALVVTDSGGVQEETTYLGIPCLTVRPNTERPVTITEGTNRLVVPGRDDIAAAARVALAGGGERGARPVPALWDGRAAERIVGDLGAG